MLPALMDGFESNERFRKKFKNKIGDENQLVKFFVQKLNTRFPSQIIENFVFMMHYEEKCIIDLHHFIEGASYGIITDQEITGEYLFSA